MSTDIRAQNEKALASVKAIYDAAEQAKADASRAQSAADEAEGHAQTALTNAATAKDAADEAQAAADKSLVQLGIIEDVSGTLNWISEHGTYTVTTDTTVQDGTVYFIYDSTTGDYTPIAQPDTTKNPHEEGWYVLDISDSQSEYIMSHLAVTSRGLWVLPSGMGTATDAQYAPNYKALLSSSGLLIYDGNGALVSTFGENITFSSSRTQRIGGTNNYIEFNASTGYLNIVGSGVYFGSTAVGDLATTVDVEEVAENLALAVEGSVYYQYTTGGVTYDVWYDSTDSKYYYYNASGTKTEVSESSLDTEDGELVAVRKNGLNDSVANAQNEISGLKTVSAGQASEIAALQNVTEGQASDIAGLAGDISTLGSGQDSIRETVTTLNTATKDLTTELGKVTDAVIINPTEPSVTVQSGTGAVKITPTQVTIKGSGKTAAWGDPESFNAQKMNAGELRPRYITWSNNTATIVGELAFVGRSNGHMSLITVL